MYAYMHVCMYVSQCMYVSMYACNVRMCVCTYVCMYVCTYESVLGRFELADGV